MGYTEDIFAALDIQDELQTRYTSGTVFHAFLGEKLPDWEAAASLVRKIAENYRLPYYTLSPTYSVCKNHGYLTGEQFVCPHCGEKTEVYSRITGYYRPIQNWNAGKTQEFKDRREYVIENSLLKHIGPVPLECSLADRPQKAAEETPAARPEEKSDSTPILFVSATCPNCRIAMNFMDKAGFSYRKVLAAENAELAKSFGVKQAPTLVLPDGTKYAGAGAIKGYVSRTA